MPVPRGPLTEVRLALSKDPLKMIVSSGCALPMAASFSATARHTPSFSNEHGPAIKRSFFGS